MGCAPCNKAKQEIVANAVAAEVVTECTYTQQQLLVWKNLLLCAKEKKLLAERELNSGLGIVASALGRADVCYFRKYLDKTEALITYIINSGQCQ